MTALRHINVELGTRVRLQGREYAFAGEVTRDGAPLAAERDLSFKDLRTAAYLTLTRADFDTLYAQGETRILRAHEQRAGRLEPAACAETQVARWRRLWCEAYDQAPCSKSDAALADFIARCAVEIDSVRPPPSSAALRTWLRERGTAGDRRVRFMADRRSGRQQPLRVDPLAMRVLSEKAEVFYDGVRLNPLAVYCAVRTAIEALNAQRTTDGLPLIKPPSESTVRRYLRRHLDYGRATRRYGWREGGRRFDPIRGSVQATHILDLAVVDQTLIDCAVIDDEHMINIGRPWLAVMIDVKSRYPLGFHLSFEPPSVETVLACLRHAVRPKTQLAQAHPEVNGEWPAFGVPDTLVVDNAWENTGSSMRDACADANISLVYAPVATPEYKGVCERFFRHAQYALVPPPAGRAAVHAPAAARRWASAGRGTLRSCSATCDAPSTSASSRSTGASSTRRCRPRPSRSGARTPRPMAAPTSTTYRRSTWPWPSSRRPTARSAARAWSSTT